MFRFYKDQYWLKIEILSPIPHNWYKLGEPQVTKTRENCENRKILWDAVIDDGGVDSS